MPTDPIIPRNPQAGTRDRRFQSAVQVILNELVRRGDIVRGSGANEWKLADLGQADIPPNFRLPVFGPGDTEEGPMGPPGTQGLTGATGPTGPAGADGSGGGGVTFVLGEDGEDGATIILRESSSAASSGATEIYARRAAIYPPFTPTGQDDEFDDSSFSGWTAVEDTAPTLTLTESNDCLSILHPGGDSVAELHAYLKAATIDAGDYVECCWRGNGRNQNFNIAGVIMSDGTTYGAGAQVALWLSPAQNFVTLAAHTNFSTAGTSSTFAVQGYPWSDIFLRLVYSGSNNWVGYISPDGISWSNMTGTLARTLTPTNWGFFCSTWGAAQPYVFSFRYVRFNNP